MIGSPDLFRSWKDVGPDGLSDVERYARTELRDGSLAWLKPTAASGTAREPTLLRRFASALRLARPHGSVPAAAPTAGIRASLAAVHFAVEPSAPRAAHTHLAEGAVLLMTRPEDCEAVHLECHEP